MRDSQDRKRYIHVSRSIRGYVLLGLAHVPEVQTLWAEMENIKHRHGGLPPAPTLPPMPTLRPIMTELCSFEPHKNTVCKCGKPVERCIPAGVQNHNGMESDGTALRDARSMWPRFCWNCYLVAIWRSEDEAE